jgi:hypothetical protein
MNQEQSNQATSPAAPQSEGPKAPARSETPAEVKKPLTPDGVAHVHVAADGTLTLTKPDGTTVEKVRLALGWPLRHRSRYIAVLDEKGHEVYMASHLDDFAADCRELIRQEVERRYLETHILAVHSLRMEHRVSYWEAETDRGRREFVLQGSETNPYRISDHRWQLIDVAGNRYEITDIPSLDLKSRTLLELLED